MKSFWLGIFIIMNFWGYSQITIFESAYNLEKLSFVNEVGNGYVTIYYDDNISVQYLAPHFMQTPVLRKPVAWSSGNSLEVEVVISSDCPSFYVKGEAILQDGETIYFSMPSPEDGSDVSPSITQQDGMNTVRLISTSTFEQGRIRYIENFTINWMVSEDGIMWKDVGESDNTLYILQGTYAGYHPQHTVIDVSCRAANGLRGQTIEEAINVVNAIFDNAFKKNEQGVFPGIRRVGEEDELTYYGIHPSEVDVYSCSFTTNGLLETGDGRCGAWASFFMSVIDVQDISETIDIFPVGILPFASSPPYTEEDINNASISNNGATPITNVSKETLENEYEVYFNSIISDEALVIDDYLFLVKNWELPIGNKFIHLSTDDCSIAGQANAQSALGALGIKGQGNVENPRSIFPNHFIIQFNNELLDPSYGVRSVNAEGGLSIFNTSLYEDAAFDVATGAFIRRRVSENTCEYYYWVERINNLEQQDFFTF